MGYTLHDKDGQPVAGDPVLDKHMKAKADEIHGYITDDATGSVVYPQED